MRPRLGFDWNDEVQQFQWHAAAVAYAGNFHRTEKNARSLLDGITFSRQLDDTVTFYHLFMSNSNARSSSANMM